MNNMTEKPTKINKHYRPKTSFERAKSVETFKVEAVKPYEYGRQLTDTLRNPS